MKIVKAIDPNDPFLKSQTHKDLKENLSGVKFGKVTVTAELLKKSKKEREKTNLISQNKAMVNPGVDPKKGSATEYVKETKLFSKPITFTIHVPKWQWGHGIAKFILGALGQNAKYLAAIREFANQLMFFTEADIPSLSKKYPDGFDFEFTYHLVKPLHLAHTIESKIITKDFAYQVTLNAQTENEPHIAYRYYMHKNLKAITEYALNQDKIMKEADKSKYPRKLPPKSLSYGNLFHKTPAASIKSDNIKFRLRKKS